MKYLISGGGTGGHIFPAISIANALCELDPKAEILFVGAKSRMEMERVPQAGYKIVGLPVRGFCRSNLLSNIPILLELIYSMYKARQIVRQFRPDAGVGVGGYASGAAMKVAAKMGVPILLQEQNGFAGVTNKLLKDDAKVICVAYEGMEKFFPKEKLILTGNPVRQNLTQGSASAAIEYFNREFSVQFSEEKKTLLIIGGSLGAKTINDAILQRIESLLQADIQVIWQTGKTYFANIEAQLQSQGLLHHPRLICTPFLSNMPDAYALSTLVISRAGASSISELCLLGKAAILVPSPNVAEDHQTHNAMALVEKDAAVLVKDAEAAERLVNEALLLITDTQRLERLSHHAQKLGISDSAKRIAEEVMKMATASKE